MILDFRLKVFTLTAHLGSFSRAASALNISQPAVSQNIAELENDIGAELFTRERGKPISLTPKGRTLLEYADRIISLYDRLNAELVPGAGNGAEKISLRIGAVRLAKEFILPQAVESYTAAYPNIGITVLERSDAESEALLRDGVIDLAVTLTELNEDSTALAHLSSAGSSRRLRTLWATYDNHSEKRKVIWDFILNTLTL